MTLFDVKMRYMRDDLEYNYQDSMVVTMKGHIPSSFGNVTALESLDLSSNKLVGEIPMQSTGLKFLEVLNLSQNQLVGPIPHGNQFNTFSNDSYGGNLGLCGFPLPKRSGKDKAHEPPKSVFHGE
ncbi:hypothetical protein CRYUN_Cryun33cG0018400 [Craigia yunnanensis]